MKKVLLAMTIAALAACGAEQAPETSARNSLTEEQRELIAERVRPHGAALPQPAQAVVPVQEALPGQTKYMQVCVACHGSQGEGGVGPALAGKGVTYVYEALVAYRAGETLGPQSALMWGQAAGLSDEDILQLAEYINTL